MDKIQPRIRGIKPHRLLDPGGEMENAQFLAAFKQEIEKTWDQFADKGPADLNALKDNIKNWHASKSSTAQKAKREIELLDSISFNCQKSLLNAVLRARITKKLQSKVGDAPKELIEAELQHQIDNISQHEIDLIIEENIDQKLLDIFGQKPDNSWQLEYPVQFGDYDISKVNDEQLKYSLKGYELEDETEFHLPLTHEAKSSWRSVLERIAERKQAAEIVYDDAQGHAEYLEFRESVIENILWQKTVYGEAVDGEEVGLLVAIELLLTEGKREKAKERLNCLIYWKKRRDAGRRVGEADLDVVDEFGVSKTAINNLRRKAQGFLGENLEKLPLMTKSYNPMF